MIQNFNFPRVLVRQNFESSVTAEEQTLAPVIIGEQYTLHRPAESGSNEEALTADYAADTGVQSAPYPGRTAGSTVDEASVKAFIKDAVLAYHTETQSGEAIKKVTGSSTKIQFAKLVLKSANGVERSLVFGDRDVQVGDKLLIKSSSNEDGALCDIIGLVSTLGSDGTKKYDTVVVSIEVPETATITSVVFCLLDDVYLGSSLVTATASTVTVAASATAETLALGEAKTATVLGGEVYIEYRERVYGFRNKLGSVYGTEDAGAVVGPAVPENPLGLAVAMAQSTAGAGFVYFTAVEDDTAEAYNKALDYLGSFRNLYSVIPATYNESVIQACFSNVQALSSEEEANFRILWFGIKANDEIPVLTGVTATASGATVTFEADALLGVNIQAGDILRINYKTSGNGTVTYDSYVIASSDETKTITLADADLTVESAERVEIWRQADETDMVNDLISQVVVHNRRATAVFADDAVFNGNIVPNWAVAAAAAGMRAYEECWRPLSNMPYSTLSVTETHGFTRSALLTLGANGIWLIGNNDYGVPINRRQLTTAASESDINQNEQSLTTNVDEICKVLRTIGGDRVGNSNISDSLLNILYDTTDNILYARTKNQSSSYVGPQLLSYEIVSFEQSATVKDRVTATIRVQPPAPLNELLFIVNVI